MTILETLADYAPVTNDTDMLTEYVRQRLGRAISKKYFTDQNTSVITLDPKLEQMMLDSLQKTDTGTYLTFGAWCHQFHTREPFETGAEAGAARKAAHSPGFACGEAVFQATG